MSENLGLHDPLKLVPKPLYVHSMDNLLKAAGIKYEHLVQACIEARKKQVAGWWMDEHPVFRQGEPIHEMEEVLTAEQANMLVSMIKDLKQQLESYQQAEHQMKESKDAATD